jgi:hypothetical protein
MRGGQRREAENVHVVHNRLACRFVRGGERRYDIDVEADTAKAEAITFRPWSWPSDMTSN